MVDLVELAGDVYVGGYVVVCVLEVGFALQVCHVLERAGPEVVHAHHAVAFREEPLAEVAPQEARTPRNERPGLAWLGLALAYVRP